MHPIKQSLIIFLVVLILPVLVFSIYEIGTLRQNEQIIDAIYTNQLDAILFSINQYSEDIISDWVDDISSMDRMEKHNEKDYLQKLKEFPSVSGYLQFDKDLTILKSAIELSRPGIVSYDVGYWLSKNDTLLDRLSSYLRGGYHKIVTHSSNHDRLLFAMLATTSNDTTHFDVLILDPEKFISMVLDPKIQQIAQDQFYIAAFKSNSDSVVYISEKQYSPVKIKHRKDFWLLQGYSLGIELRDTTIDELARSRSKKDLILIGIVDLILILGIGIIYFNMKKQMELSKLKTDFISNVSHEIRTPLALISMYIETLEMGRAQSKEKIQEYYQIILQETQRLSGIVNKILSFSQIENEKRTYSFTMSDLNVIVRRVTETYRFSLERKGFKYSIECMPELPEVKVDADAVADAVVNLIDNAMKYSDSEKNIRITTGNNKDWIYIEVADRGIGIAESEQKYIFDKFYRATEKNLAYKAKGSGLGLAIVKHIMDAHHGVIEIKSQKGKGSIFRLMFPVK